MYYLVVAGSKKIKKAKGVNENVVKNRRQRICWCFVQ